MQSLINFLSDEERQALDARWREAVRAEHGARVDEKAQRMAKAMEEFEGRKLAVHATGPQYSKFVSLQEFAQVVKAQQRRGR